MSSSKVHEWPWLSSGREEIRYSPEEVQDAGVTSISDRIKEAEQKAESEIEWFSEIKRDMIDKLIAFWIIEESCWNRGRVRKLDEIMTHAKVVYDFFDDFSSSNNLRFNIWCYHSLSLPEIEGKFKEAIESANYSNRKKINFPPILYAPSSSVRKSMDYFKEADDFIPFLYFVESFHKRVTWVDSMNNILSSIMRELDKK